MRPGNETVNSHVVAFSAVYMEIVKKSCIWPNVAVKDLKNLY